MKLLFFLVVPFSFLSFNAVRGYRAAVLEYSPLGRDTPTNTILANIKEYRRYATDARDDGVDIMVFPEYGLTGFTSDPEEYAIDLSEPNISKPIQDLSAIAVEHSMYLVINLLEKAKNENGTFKYHNTNIVFNRKGEIQARYRKINLYNEPKLTPGADLVTFTTDFDVTFGVFICFDILFENPSRTILKGNVTDVVYSTGWFSVTPYYTALSVQRGYSLSSGANLLAANYNNPKKGNGGSGIYFGNGTIAENYVDGIKITKLIIHEVPKIGKRYNNRCSSIKNSAPFTPTNSSGFVADKDFNASQFTFQNINLSEENTEEVCHNELFCCTFNIVAKLQANNAEIYKAAVGEMMLNKNESSYIRVCGLLACETDSIYSCGQRIANLTTLFSKINITTNFKANNHSFFVPVSVKTDLTTITQVNYCEQEISKSNKTAIEFSTLEKENQILFFGLWGQGEKSAAVIKTNGILSSLIFSAIVIFQAKL